MDRASAQNALLSALGVALQEAEVKEKLESGWQAPAGLDEDESALARRLMKGLRLQ